VCLPQLITGAMQEEVIFQARKHLMNSGHHYRMDAMRAEVLLQRIASEIEYDPEATPLSKRPCRFSLCLCVEDFSDIVASAMFQRRRRFSHVIVAMAAVVAVVTIVAAAVGSISSVSSASSGSNSDSSSDSDSSSSTRNVLVSVGQCVCVSVCLWGLHLATVSPCV
jgi:hypothetical protein